jgi:hypothetical protein
MFEAASKDFNGSLRMYLPVEFKVVANGENEQDLNPNQSKLK